MSKIMGVFNTILSQVSDSRVVNIATGAYHGMVNSKITLTPGVWKVTGQVQMYTSGNTQLYITNGTGFYAANGNDTPTVPTDFSSTVLYKGTGGVGQSFGKVFGNTIMGGASVNIAGIDQGEVTPVVVGYFKVAANTDVFLVPKVNTNNSTTTGATIQTMIIAERII